MKIIGITVGTTMPKPNYEQTDPTKGDYIKGDIISAITPDTTLTQEGHVADSKVVGDKIAEINAKLDDITDKLEILDNLEGLEFYKGEAEVIE